MAGSGAVRLIGPLAASVSSSNRIAPTTSSRCTHGTYCLPPATGPPMPALKKGSIFSSAPPESERTIPVRFTTTRTPSSSARRASASHSTDSCARKSSPAGADSSSRSSPRKPYQPAPDWETRTRGRSPSGSSPSALTRLRVERIRESRISRFASSDQRWAICSPSRLTTPSRPRRASSGGCSRLGISPLLRAHPKQIAGPLGVTGERGHVIAAFPERADERAPDRPGRAGHGDPHQLTVARSTVGCSGSASSSPRSATSATALATSRATSRLKTLGMM